VAHRGWPARYPENTLVGVGAALAAGARRVEVDVQLTADRIPVLLHDATLERVCGVPGAVADRRLADLSGLSACEPKRLGDAFAGEPIATLAGFVDLLLGHPGATAFVEVKPVAAERPGDDGALDAVLPELDRLAAGGVQAVLISYRSELLAAARRRGRRPLGLVLGSWRQLGREETAALAPEVVFCSRHRLPRRGSLADPLGSGARLAVYEIAEPEVAVALGRRGVALVETFAIGEMLAAFAGLASAATPAAAAATAPASGTPPR
jgi:glycerophosphoryl diester phosphodiesterase